MLPYCLLYEVHAAAADLPHSQEVAFEIQEGLQKQNFGAVDSMNLQEVYPDSYCYIEF